MFASTDIPECQKTFENRVIGITGKCYNFMESHVIFFSNLFTVCSSGGRVLTFRSFLEFWNGVLDVIPGPVVFFLE
jgi:hypothetical protein